MHSSAWIKTLTLPVKRSTNSHKACVVTVMGYSWVEIFKQTIVTILVIYLLFVFYCNRDETQMLPLSSSCWLSVTLILSHKKQDPLSNIGNRQLLFRCGQKRRVGNTKTVFLAARMSPLFAQSRPQRNPPPHRLWPPTGWSESDKFSFCFLFCSGPSPISAQLCPPKYHVIIFLATQLWPVLSLFEFTTSYE